MTRHTSPAHKPYGMKTLGLTYGEAATLLAAALSGGSSLKAQQPAAGFTPDVPGNFRLLQPRTPPPALTPATLQLLTLDGQLQQATLDQGGKGFASWFAEDGVILADRKPPVSGMAAIAASATWDPKAYQLAWTAEGAQMSPSGDMGFTWGHYVARTLDPKNPAAPPTDVAGRYITVWKKTPSGWKIALESSGQDTSAAIPQPAPALPAK